MLSRGLAARLKPRGMESLGDAWWSRCGSRGDVMVSSHLVFLLLETTLLVKWDVIVAAVQDGLVASHPLADSSERLDNPQTKLATLHALINRNILDMANTSKVASELLLQENRANAYNGVCLARDDNQRVVGVGT